jgi:hypothetical protein
VNNIEAAAARKGGGGFFLKGRALHPLHTSEEGTVASASRHEACPLASAIALHPNGPLIRFLFKN